MSEIRIDWIDKAHDWVAVSVDEDRTCLVFESYDDNTKNAAAIYDINDSEKIIDAIRSVTGTADLAWNAVIEKLIEYAEVKHEEVRMMATAYHLRQLKKYLRPIAATEVEADE